MRNQQEQNKVDLHELGNFKRALKNQSIADLQKSRSSLIYHREFVKRNDIDSNTLHQVVGYLRRFGLSELDGQFLLNNYNKHDLVHSFNRVIKTYTDEIKRISKGH